MKFCLILAAGLLVAASANRIAADVLDVLPADPYNTMLGSTGWQPAQKVYSLANTSFDWVYWQGSNASGSVECMPHGGWIPPGGSANLTLCPAAAMATASPGTYNEQVALEIDPRLVGDVNGDTIVNALDVLTLAETWAAQSGDVNYDLTCDFNNDGVVDVLDLLNIANNFGRTFGGTVI